MRCVSCGEDIPPKWVVVIERNVCPSCDGPIMTSDAISLRDELADALMRMPNDPQGITGWLLSNYKVQKIGDAEPVERFSRPEQKLAQSTQQSPSKGVGAEGPELKEFKIASSPYEEFLARTDFKNKVQETSANVRTKQDRMAQMAANIASVEDPYGENVNQNVSTPTPESDQEDYLALQHMKSQAQSAPELSASALSPDQIAMMQNQGAPDIAAMGPDGVARANVGMNDGDLSDAERLLISQTGNDGHKVVHNNRLKRIKAQEAIETGGGSFTRA
jgi:hypothetical protein